MDNKYEFNIGDIVIESDGSMGTIVDICHCDRCEMRGFYEPMVDFGRGYYNYITHWDNEENYSNYYSIGKYIFGNMDLDGVNERISKLEKLLEEERAKRTNLLFLMEAANDLLRED